MMITSSINLHMTQKISTARLQNLFMCAEQLGKL